MTTQTERKPFEKKILPEKKPILCLFNKPPKEGKPATFNGNESPRIFLTFRVADNKYPDLVGYPVFFRCNPWINNYQGKSTKLYDLLCEMAQEELGQNCCQVDARDLFENDWKPFYGYYVVKMEPPQFDESGALKWQDIEEILHPEGIEFPVDSRKADVHGGRPSEPLGLPKPKQAPVEDKPPQAPVEEIPQLKRTFGTLKEMIGELKGLVASHPDFVKLKDAYLKLKGAELVSNLPEADIKHLLVLFWLEEHRMNGGVVAARIGAELMNRHKALHQLDPAEALFLLAASDREADDPLPF